MVSFNHIDGILSAEMNENGDAVGDVYSSASKHSLLAARVGASQAPLATAVQQPAAVGHA
jgi:hypothetical protein